jgi:hypothetical protein
MPSASFPTLGAQLIVVTSLLVSALGIPIVAAADYADSVRARPLAF